VQGAEIERTTQTLELLDTSAPLSLEAQGETRVHDSHVALDRTREQRAEVATEPRHVEIEQILRQAAMAAVARVP
jgi:hypothetical protein